MLPEGADIRFSTPVRDDSYPAFTKAHIRGIAAGIDVPYEYVSGDLEGVNYSSIRAGVTEYRRRLEQIQHTVVVFQFCRKIWERLVTLAVLTGRLPAHDFHINQRKYLAVDWLPQRFDYVNPKDDIEAEVIAINNRLKSRSEAVAGRGYDVEKVDQQIANDRAREARLGIAGDPNERPGKGEVPK